MAKRADVTKNVTVDANMKISPINPRKSKEKPLTPEKPADKKKDEKKEKSEYKSIAKDVSKQPAKQNEKPEDFSKTGEAPKTKTEAHDLTISSSSTISKSKAAGKKRKNATNSKQPAVEAGSIVEEQQANGFDEGDQDEAPITTVHLNSGDLITIMDKEYLVEGIIAKGLVGQIYRVTNTATKERKQYALKSEDVSYRGKRLRNEITFLKALMEVGKPSQLPTLFSTGRNETCRFMVTDLYGDNLRDLNRKNRFSLATCLKVAHHTFEAICELHTVGHYVHRCLAPSNFCASSREATSASVCLVNFSMSRKFRGEDKSKQKSRVRFYGNIRYASRNAHLLKDRSRKDDLESWLYISLDFFDESTLPWNQLYDRTEIYFGKLRFFDSPNANVKTLECGSQWSAMANAINKIPDNEAPDYRSFRRRIDDSASKCKVNLSEPICWNEKKKQ